MAAVSRAGEFELIDIIVTALGDRAVGQWVQTGPGDDAAVIVPTPGCDAVASIDSLLADVHFPLAAPAELIGYRAMMVALSDLAAMAAIPRYVLVALSFTNHDARWLQRLASGIADAARHADVYVCGGNISSGPCNITVSVHGEVPAQQALVRSGARPGDRVWVSGVLGGAAACVREEAIHQLTHDNETATHKLSVLQTKYFHPQARFDCVEQLRLHASAGIDVSDGLLADLAHVAKSSGVAIDIDLSRVPVCPGALLNDALNGGDDYEIACTSTHDLEGFFEIGKVSAGAGMLVDGQAVTPSGYDHFSA